MKNNKGTTIIEVVVTLSMLLIIILSMMSLIISLRKTNKRNEITKEITEYKNIISRKINDDLITLKLKSIDSCDNIYEDYVYCYKLIFNDQEKELLVNTGMDYIKYDGIKYKLNESSKLKKPSLVIEDNIFNLKIDITNNKTHTIKIIYPM